MKRSPVAETQMQETLGINVRIHYEIILVIPVRYCLASALGFATHMAQHH